MRVIKKSYICKKIVIKTMSVAVTTNSAASACSHEEYARACEIILKGDRKHNVNDRLDKIPFDLIDKSNREACAKQLSGHVRRADFLLRIARHPASPIIQHTSLPR